MVNEVLMEILGGTMKCTFKITLMKRWDREGKQ